MSLIELFTHANQLKRTARTGWVMRGVQNAENVAAHSYGVAFIAMVLAEVVETETPIDLAKLLSMALLHDLPEAITTDLPAPAWRRMPPGLKSEVERSAMMSILGTAEFPHRYLELWEELHAKETAEAKLLKDADLLDMYLQAKIYQEQTGNTHLAEFWQTSPTFYYPEAQTVYNALRAELAMNNEQISN